MTRLTEHGISTTTQPGQFAYDEYYSEIAGGPRVQWDYRDNNGKLHSGIAKSLKEAERRAAEFGYVGGRP